jgi:hypothetical protein
MHKQIQMGRLIIWEKMFSYKNNNFLIILFDFMFQLNKTRRGH